MAGSSSSRLLNRILFHLYTAKEGLFRNRLRSLLSSLGIIFGVAAFVSMLAVAKGAGSHIVSGIEELGLRNVIVKPVSSGQQLSDRMVRLVRRSGLFSSISPVRIVRGQVTDATEDIRVLAVAPSFGHIFRTAMAYGRFIHVCDVRKGASVAVAGAEAAKSLGLAYRSGGSITIDEQAFELVGILAPRQWAVKKKGAILAWDINRCLFIPYDPRLYQGADLIVLQTKKGHDVLKSAQILSRMMKIRGMDARLIVPLALRNQAMRSKRIFDMVLGAIAAISLLVGGIGIANVMLASVAERNTEIGLRRTFGAERIDILFQFLAEAALMGTAGSLAGLASGALCAKIIEGAAGVPVSVTVDTMALGFLMGLSTSLIASLLPAYKASKTDPLAAIRFNTW